MGVLLIGSGHALPKRVLTNSDLSKMVDTSDEWISSRTGIKTRYIVDEKQGLTDIAVQAAKEVLKNTPEVDVMDISLIILATSGADKSFPSGACEVQAKLGIKNAICFDLSAACSGFIFGLHTAECMMKAGGYRYALVIGAEVLSRMIDWQDRSTCVLFGDGAGAVILKNVDNTGQNQQFSGILSTSMGSNGEKGNCLVRACFGQDVYLHMEGQEVFKFAVRTVPESIEKALQKANISKEEVKSYILHQANFRIIQSVAKKLEEPIEKFPVNMQRVGNTSAASVPILLDEELRAGHIQKGDIIVLSGFGAGLTWGSMVIRY